jgi:hypothetical protein
MSDMEGEVIDDWLIAVEVRVSPSLKTIVWSIYTRRTDVHIGDVRWHPKAAHYALFINGRVVLHSKSMKSLASFLDRKNEGHATMLAVQKKAGSL